MSDLFYIPNQDEEEWKKQKEAYAQKKQAQIEQGDYWQQKVNEVRQEQQKRVDNYNRYGVDVPDAYYEQFNKIISRAEDPEQAQNEAYRIGSAIKYSEMYNIPLDEAYTKVDALNEAQFPDIKDQKGCFEALCDMFTLGTNNVKLGRLGQKLMTANNLNDTEMSDSLKAQIDAINQTNDLLQDKVPRKWIMEALEVGAKSLPFTGAVAGAGIFGNFIAPGVGTGAAFATSSYLTAGLEYIDMLANGATPQTASIVANVSGVVQGLIEADLGITKGIVKGTSRLIGKETAKRAAGKALEEIGTKFAKRFHFGAAKKLLVNYLMQYVKNVLGEGTEEFLQEITSVLGQEIAASLDGYDIPDDDFNSIKNQVLEAARGGILGALSMGFIPAGINGAADIASFKKIKDTAEVYESGEMFKEAVKDNPVFDGMSDEKKSSVIQEVWEQAQQRKEQEAKAEAQNLAETLDAGEGAEERAVNEEGEETEAEPVYRTENGKLDIQDDEHVNDDGTVTGTFVVGDSTKKDNNRYGYITYSADEENKTVTIDTFKMTEGREGLRGEFYDEFAQKYAGYDIKWNPNKSESQNIKETLIENNPTGKKAGLNYYANNDIDDISTRKKVAAEIKKNIHNITRNADGSFTKTELTNKQVASSVALLEAGAKRVGMNLTEYVNKTFGNKIFGDMAEFEKAAAAQGDTTSGKAGGMGWQQYGNQIKAIIYAGENADFSTWAHELAHVFQSQLDGDLKIQAEKAFNVQNGDWINSKYTFADGHVDSAAEAFAYGFQDWLKTGKAQNEEMKNIFQKFAEFIVRAYNALKNHINLTPEIENVYNQLLQGDDSLLRKAEKAVEQEDREYKANLKRKAEEETNAQKAKAEEAKRTQEAEREEVSETTDFVEKQQETTLEQAEKQLNEVTNEEKATGESNEIDNAVENLDLTDEEKTEITDTLKNEDATVIEKSEAVTKAAESVYAEDEETPDMLFQKEIEEAGKSINKDNYFKDTYAQWTEVTEKDLPKANPDYKSASGSEYWYTDKGVYRKSNHWGKVASCRWYLNDNVIQNETVYQIGYADFNNFQKMMYNSNMEKLIAQASKYILPNGEEAVQEWIDNLINDQEELLERAKKYRNNFLIPGYEKELKDLRSLSVDKIKDFVIPEWDSDKERNRILFQKVTDKERDDEYKQAVESGNTEKAMQMLQEEAERKGYNLSSDYQGTSAFNGAAPYRNGYFETKEARLQAIKDEEFEDTETLGDFAYDNADALGFDYMINDPRAYRVADEKRKEAIDNLRNAIKEAKSGKRNVTIKMYRSVPADIKENSFRNGDWITPSKSYAEDNADVHGWEKGESRIIEQDVDLEHVWWDGNDIAEWGWDDEKEAVYKNTGNNRKLFEITYDKDGNLIPLSKRFDESNPSLLFQIAGEIGAQNLDNAEVQEGVSRMENLAIAKQMETEGKSPMDIRLATAWERGDDGLWRYEIDDSKIKTDFEDKALRFRKENPRYGELEAKLKSLNYDWEKLSKNEQEEFEKLGDLYSENYYKNEVILMDILDAPELFKAYPQFKEMPVKFMTRDFSKEYEAQLVNGYYEDTNEPYFEIQFNGIPNSYNSDNFKSTLLHEIQHAIQRIEGFAKGGNLGSAAKVIEEENQKKTEIKNKAFAWEWKIELEKQEEKHPELRGNLALMDSLIDEYTENGKYTVKELENENWLPERNIRDKGFNLYVRGYDKEGFEDAYKEWQETASKKGILYFEPTKNTDRNRYNYYRRFAGEVESRNVQERMNYTPEERLLATLKSTEDVWPTDKIILFQTVYHGTGADFDKFDTENFGFSGEGSMSFGYGTYFTDSEEIARSYAERQRKQFEKDADNPYERDSLEYEMFEDLRSFDFDKDRYKEYLLKESENIKKDKDNPYQDFKADNKLALLDNINSTNLYTVEIPDNGFILWDEDVDTKTVERVKKAVFKKLTTEPDDDGEYPYKGVERELQEELNDAFDGSLTGQTLYNNVAIYAGSEKNASKLLNKIGFTGINYPAYSNFGNAMGKSARNFVIFNDEDTKIIEHLLFQTNAELMDEARTFDSWQDFMDFYEVMGKPEVTPIPYDADAQWYQSFWEMAHGMQTEQEKNEAAMHDKAEKDGTVPMALDAMFATVVQNEPEMLDNFLKNVADIDAIDLDSEEWRNVQDEADAKERTRIEELKDFINITLSDYNWQTAIKRVQGGHEIAEGLRKRLIGEMTDSFKTRDFRALYSEIMDDESYAVEPEDSTATQLSKKLSKYQKRYYDILKPNEDIARVSPERRKRIAEAMQNKDIAAKIKSGKLKLDDELDTYIKSLDRQVKDIQKEYDELERETKNDYQRIADAERRRLLKLHDELLIARGRMQTRNQEIERKIAKGLKITEKYRRESQNMTANYDELFRKFADLKDSIQITAEVQAALDRQERIAGLKQELNSKQKEKSLTDEVKKMRIQLVKRTMRRVPFNRIDYENAKTVIAIQRMLEPNLLGGVNRFIGIDSPFLRGVISGIVTDSDYKDKILKYLDKTAKASEAFVNFKKKLMDLKSVKDFDSWTAKERKYAIKHLPKENWVYELNLNQLAKEREESIDLDIGMKEIQEPVYDEKTGEIKTYKDNDGIEHNVTRTGFRLKYDEELGQMVKDAVGADMFDRIINKPFSEWTTEELEQLAQRIDELYTEGRDLLAAKNKARKLEAKRIRKNIEDAIKETGITINDDDTPEEKARKREQIDKILGLNDSNIKGTEAGKTKGIKAKLDRLVHSYNDLNVLRFARILDGQSEGENVRMLYRREDDCYNAKQRSIYNRTSTVKKVMADQKITEGDLAKTIKVSRIGTEFTVDELLYFLAADKDYAEDEALVAKGEMGIDANDDYAPTSRNAVMFGNMMSDAASQEEKELFVRLDEEMKDAIENDTLTPVQKEQLAIGQFDKKPGTTRYIARCHAKWKVCIAEAMNFLAEHPEYNALMEAIEADYASQYERMNEISINEFNTPVHRVECYVPLVRRESNGDTNVNQVKEDLLGAYGAESGKQWVNKGMTKRRQNISPLHQKPVQTGLFRTWADSIERTEHFIAYSPYVRQLNEVYKSRDAAYTRRFIEARYGRGAVEYLDSYINEVANPNAGKIREKGAELLHTLRGKTAPAYLGWKFSAVVKQALTSPWPYMQFVNPAEYLASCFDCVNGGYEAIKEKSVFMKNRVMNPLIELVDEMQDQAKNNFDRKWSNFTKKGMAGLEWIDWTCVAPGWLACYKKEYNRLQHQSEAAYQAKKEKLIEQNMKADISTSEYLTPDQIEAKAREELLQDIELAAVQYADDCTRQCQPSSRVTDLAPLFKNSSEAMKAFLQFQTSLNVIWQNIRYDLPYAIKQKQFDRVAGAVMGYVFAGIFMNSVMEGIKGDDDDDKELQSLRNLIYYATTQFTDAIPIIGSEITNTMDQLITGKRGFYSTGTDMTPSATKLLSALNKARNGNWQKAAALTAEGIGLFMGAPVSGIKEINKLLGKPLEEGDVNLLRGISDVYGLAGDIIGE